MSRGQLMQGSSSMESYVTVVHTSAGRSLGFSVSMFVSDICNQTSNIADYGVEVLKRQIKY